MKFHEFLKLPFSDTVLANFLHVSLPTIGKLRRDEPLSRTTLKNIGRHLQVDDTEIVAELERLKTQKRDPPITLDVNNLTITHQIHPRPLAAKSGVYALSCVFIKPHQLIVTIVQDTTRLEKRMNHALYQDQWQRLSPCPLDTLTPSQLQDLMRSVFHKQKARQVVVDRKYFDHAFMPFLTTILPILKTTSIEQSLDFYFDHRMLPQVISPELLFQQQNTLHRFAQINHLGYVQLHRIEAEQNLAVQAARLVALATKKLPADQLAISHIRLQTINQAQQATMMREFLRFEKRAH